LVFYPGLGRKNEELMTKSERDYLEQNEQGRIQGGVLGVNPPPPLWENFSNLLVFFKKKS